MSFLIYFVLAYTFCAGLDKFLLQVDEICAAREGMYQRPLTQPNVEKHLAEFGLEAEFGSHSRMAALSGGQKVKVVLASCMWNQPHIVILDEPTNYLDRDSLGALANAIRDFEGGIALITVRLRNPSLFAKTNFVFVLSHQHNDQFSKTVCTETWLIDAGKLNLQGADWMSTQAAAQEDVTFQQMEVVVRFIYFILSVVSVLFFSSFVQVDAMGNQSAVKQAKKVLSRKEKQARIKSLKAKVANGETLDSSDEEFLTENSAA